jgi:hypothetical protein
MTGDIKSSNTATPQNLFATNTSYVNLGGSGGVLIGKTATYPNTYLEIAPSGYNTWLDFHCSTVANDFDARIVATAGGVGDGKAILGFISGTFDVSANTNIHITTPKIDCETTNYINMSSPTTTLKQTTANIISTTALNMSAPTIKINTKTFRYVPWTTSFRSTIGTATISTIVSVPSGGTQPTCHANANVIYRYSIVGNTMHINFYFYQANAGTAGSGYYQYAIPATATYYIDSTDIQSSTNGTANGTRLGTMSLKRFGGNNEVGSVFIIGSGAGARLILQAEAGSSDIATYRQQDSSYFQYSQSGLLVCFEATIPILP